mmetsp:Transcript_76/g.245  ORF Transcript_76/g.245 Transcript_76/m.245 type:complete len:178 (-) Transcript_76:294-827(-)
MPNGASQRERMGAWSERIEKETRTWMEGERRRDPFATTLANLVGGGPMPEPTGRGNRSNGSDMGSRVSHRSSTLASSALEARDELGSMISHRGGGSQLARRPRSQLSAADGQSAISWRTPSSIRSSEPSEIARNKIAELQLRVELERVTRLQREMEFEKKRKDGLIKEGSSLLDGRN